MSRVKAVQVLQGSAQQEIWGEGEEKQLAEKAAEETPLGS